MKKSQLITTLLFFFPVLLFGEESLLNIKLLNISKVIEPDTVFISSINNIQFSPDNKYYIASSFMETNAYLFESKNDSLIKIFFPSEYLSDSISNQLAKFQYPFTFISTIQLKLLNPRMNPNMVSNKITDALFLNDSIIIFLQSIKVVKFPNNVDISTYTPHRFKTFPVITYFNILNNKIIKAITLPNVIDNNGYYRAFYQSKLLRYNRSSNTFLVSIMSSDYEIDSLKSKNLYSVAEVDSIGQLVSIKNILPEEYNNSGLNYSFNYFPFVSKNKKNKYFYLYNSVPFLFDDNNKKRIFLSNSSDNKSFFDTLTIISEQRKFSYIDISEIRKEKLQTIYNQFFFDKKNNLFLHYTMTEKISDSVIYRNFLNMYDSKYKFLKKYELETQNLNGTLSYLRYNNNDNTFRLFRKNDETWIIEKFIFN